MKKTVITVGLVVVMLIGITYAFAQGPGFGPGDRGAYSKEGRGPDYLSSLTPEQKTKFQELRQKFNEETAQLRGSLLTKKLELQSLWTNPKADPKAIIEKEKELRNLKNQMGDKAIELKLETRKILTPEQIAQLGAGWGKGHGFGRGHMRGHGMDPGYGACR